MSEQRKILDMLASGQINTEEAEKLLNALGADKSSFSFATSEAKPKGAARLLRINIDAEDEAKVHVNVPLALAKFASQFLPKEAKEKFEVQEIDLNAIIDSLGDEVSEGRIVDIEAFDEDTGRTVKIVIEVV